MFAAMHEHTKARLRLAGAAILFSTGGAAIKAAPFTSWQVASFGSGTAALPPLLLLPGARPSLRSGTAALALLLLLPAARRGWSWRAMLVGVAYAATLTLFVLANKLTTS